MLRVEDGGGLVQDPDGEAQAFAAAGVIAAGRTGRGDRPMLGDAQALREALTTEPVSWVAPGEVDSPSLRTLLDTNRLARAWVDAVDEAPRPPRIAIRQIELALETRSTVELLSLPAVRASSVYVSRDWRMADDTWHWPLRVRAVRGGDEERKIRGQYHKDNRLRVLDPGDPDAADLAVFFGDVDSTLERLIRGPTHDASALLIVGERSGWGLSESALERLRSLLHARAIALMDVQIGNPIWFERLLDSLSNDMTLDEALMDVTRSRQLQPPLVFGSGPFLAQARLHALARAMLSRRPAQSAELAKRELRFRDHDVPALEELAFAPPLATAAGSPELALLRDSVERLAEDEATRPVAEERFLQAQVRAPTGDEPVTQTLLPATNYLLAVKVAAPADSWTKLDERFPFERLPSGMASYTLTVSFVELAPRLSVQAATIELPAIGPSSIAPFTFRTPEDGADIRGRLLILHRGRILQTSLITLYVTRSDGAERNEGAMSLAREAEVRRDLTRLGRRRRFDAAFLTNKHEGNGRVTAFVGPIGVVMPTSDLDVGSADITALLVAHVNDSMETQPLASPATQQLLVKLAQRGAILYQVLVLGQPWAQTIASVLRVQVVSVNLDEYLPLELMYERKSPKTGAALCPHADDELASGDPTGCPTLGPDAASYVCPLGFWGLSRIIERHATRTSLNGATARLESEPAGSRGLLHVFKAVVGGASSRADAVNTQGTAKVKAALVAISPGSWVHDWEDWKARLTTFASQDATLLFAIPHVDSVGGQPAMELGKQRLLRSDVDASYVRGPLGGSPGPLTVLLGCETHLAPIRYQNFASAFRLFGAPVVMSTVATVLGRHAVPVALELLTQLQRWSQEEAGTVGDAMTTMRRNMVREGIVIALALTAYGDADWRIA